MWDGSESLSQFAQRKIAEGERDATVIAREFLEAVPGEEQAKDHLQATFPAVREYIRNRARDWVKGLEREIARQATQTPAGESMSRTEATMAAAPRQDKTSEQRVVTRLQRYVAESIHVPGHGYMLAGDCEESHFLLAIGELEQQKRGADKTIKFYRWCIAQIKAAGVQRLGDVPDLPEAPPGE